MLHHSTKEKIAMSLTGNPDVVQLRGLLHHLSGKCSQSQLQLLPVQWVPHPHLLRSEKTVCLCIGFSWLSHAHILWILLSDLLEILRCGRQQRLSVFHPLSGQIDILPQSKVLQPATHLLLSPLTERNTHVTGKKNKKKHLY